MSIVNYIIKETLHSLRQEWAVVSVSILTIGITLFFFAVIRLALFNVTDWVAHQEQRADITLYCAMELSYEDEVALFDKVAARGDVGEAVFISRQQGYDRFKALYGEDLLLAVEDNPFPAAIEITPKNPSASVAEMAKKLQDLSGVESVSFAAEWIEKVAKFKKQVNQVGWTMIVILMMASFFVIKNTVQLTVYTRRDLVRNMQYVGASHWRIRAPFLLEGGVQGALGAFLAWMALMGLKSTVFKSAQLNWWEPHLLPALLLGGLLLGIMSGYLAVRRFIR